MYVYIYIHTMYYITVSKYNVYNTYYTIHTIVTYM